MRVASLVVGILCTATTVAAESVMIGDLMIDQARAGATPSNAMAGAGYFQITNTGTTPDRLIAVEANFPRVMIHDTQVVDDVARMVHLDGVDLPAGETVTLSPGGLHVMFMGLNGDPLEEGETVPATLVFENAGQVEVKFDVVSRKDLIDGGHSGNGSHDHK